MRWARGDQASSSSDLLSFYLENCPLQASAFHKVKTMAWTGPVKPLWGETPVGEDFCPMLYR